MSNYTILMYVITTTCKRVLLELQTVLFSETCGEDTTLAYNRCIQEDSVTGGSLFPKGRGKRNEKYLLWEREKKGEQYDAMCYMRAVRLIERPHAVPCNV